GLFSLAGRAALARGDAGGAEPLLRAALAQRERAHGARDARLAHDLAYLNGALLALGHDAEAVENGRRTVDLLEAAYGPRHRLTILHTNNLGALLRRAGDMGGAEAAFARALEHAEATVGAGAPYVATVNSNLADVKAARGDLAGARAHLERALAIDEAAYGPRHNSVARDLHKLARLLARLGEREAARPLFARALAHFEAARGADDAHTRALRAEIAALDG
ncbi:MAG TPA: tetratricopeptide repeat protein, partial [Longimicrobium sp.]|nr:tetratricopeptide repeat protein [Longimicrobium sp.]